MVLGCPSDYDKWGDRSPYRRIQGRSRFRGFLESKEYSRDSLSERSVKEKRTKVSYFPETSNFLDLSLANWSHSLRGKRIFFAVYPDWDLNWNSFFLFRLSFRISSGAKKNSWIRELDRISRACTAKKVRGCVERRSRSRIRSKIVVKIHKTALEPRLYASQFQASHHFPFWKLGGLFSRPQSRGSRV